MALPGRLKTVRTDHRLAQDIIMIMAPPTRACRDPEISGAISAADAALVIEGTCIITRTTSTATFRLAAAV